MRKSSRFWWLHGAILFAAVAGCNRNCTNGGGGCGPGMNNSPYTGGAGVGGPIGGAGVTGYSQGGATPGIPSGGAFPSSANSGYSMPGLSSGMSQPGGLGGARP